MKRKSLWLVLFFVVLFVGAAFLFGLCASFFSNFSDEPNNVFSRGNVALVLIEGEILDSQDVIDALQEARKENHIKVVLLRLNSPGGAVAPSQEILHEVERVAAKKPVVASMGSLAASGAYYIAVGATKIVANPGTVTGSIGVRMDHVEFGGLLKWARIGHETLKSGKYKDLAPLDRPMTEEERKILQDVLADIHAQFKEDVATRRKLDKRKVDELADGRIFTGRQALELGLVDELGSFSDALILVGKLAGIEGEPKLVTFEKSKLKFLERFFESVDLLTKAFHSEESSKPVLRY